MSGEVLVVFLATMRNWVSVPAFGISRFLYFYRLGGVVAFEFTQVRALLLIFPNTFEYFFIAYEGVRARWSPLRFSLRWWLAAAALIWVVVKLPQEYWIHVAQLDVTDVLSENAWAPPLLAAVLLLLAAVLWFVVRPRLPEADWPLRLEADRLPEEMDTAEEVSAWHADTGAVRSWATVEKIALVGLVSVGAHSLTHRHRRDRCSSSSAAALARLTLASDLESPTGIDRHGSAVAGGPRMLQRPSNAASSSAMSKARWSIFMKHSVARRTFSGSGSAIILSSTAGNTCQLKP